MACVAIIAVLSLVEPHMTGPGGDCFALFYSAKDKKVHGINGCGRSASKLTADYIKSQGIPGPRIPATSIYSVNVPGAVAGWIDIIEKWGNGKLTLAEILEPAIQLAENGAPISAVSAELWAEGVDLLKKQGSTDLLKNGKPLKTGEIWINRKLANTFKLMASHGKAGFYEGTIADSIVDEVQKRGGLITHEDLKNHTSTFVDPISVEFDGLKLWEIPPNGQGLVALHALGIIRELAKNNKIELSKLKHNSIEYLHLITETLKLGFADADEYVTDQSFYSIPLEELISEEYLAKRGELFDPLKSKNDFTNGIPNPVHKSDTVYFTASDPEGNACSFINSVFWHFGSGIVPPNTGFPLHNRGANFNLTKGSRNVIEGGKRPYHTIIPAMITKDDDLWSSFGVMGGFMQPQGHLQVFLNMTLFGFDPQQALDAPRLCLFPDESKKHLDKGKGSSGPMSTPTTIVGLEEGVPEDLIKGLEAKGHKVVIYKGAKRGNFGRGQIIRKFDTENGLLYSAGSDFRGDGAAVSLI